MSSVTTKTYDTPSEFTYDTSKIVVTTDAKLKAKVYTDESFFADYTQTINGRRGLGVLTGTATGGAAIASGYLNLKGGTAKNVEHVAAGNMDVLVQTGCIRFNVKPNYSGTPTNNQYFFMVTESAISTANLLEIRHDNAAGFLYVAFKTSTGGVANMATAAWSPVAGTEYDIELNFDVTTGETRLFVDGVQIGATFVTAFTRSSSIGYCLVGADSSGVGLPDYEIRNLEVFSTVQHTANFTPSTDFSTYYSEADIIPNTVLGLNSISSLAITESVLADTAITYYLKWDGFYYYWNGVAWVVSDRSVAQSNTRSVLLANIGTFDASVGDEFTIGAILQSTNGYSTPALTSWALTYTFFNVPEVIAKCLVHFELYDSSGSPLNGAEVRFDIDDFWYGEALISAAVTAKTGVDGKGQVEVVETATYGKTATIIISHESIPPLRYDNKTIPNKEVEALSVIVA